MGKEVSEVTEKKNIFESIQAVMGEIGAVGKTSKNAQQGFMYRGIDAVMNALQPALIKHGVFVVPEILEQTREERVNAKGNTLIYSICKIKYNFYAQDGSSVSATVIGEGMDPGDKATNKAMSIAFKYACFQVFCIPTEEMVDPDSECHEVKLKAKAENKEEPKAENKLSGKKASAKQIELLNKLIPEADREKMLKWAGVDKIEDMPIEAASKIISEKTKKEE